MSGSRRTTTTHNAALSVLANAAEGSGPVASTSAIPIDPQLAFPDNNAAGPASFSHYGLNDGNDTSRQTKSEYQDPALADIDYEGGERIVVEQPGSIEISLPWHKHFYGQTLPPNTDGQERDEYFAAIRIIPWTKGEKRALRREVILFNRARADSVEGRFIDDEEAERRTDNIDWNEICRNVELKRRSPSDCRIHWLQHEHPDVCKDKWSREETQRLYTIAETHDLKNWTAIAAELNGTGQMRRTAVDCIKQYRAKPITKTAWSSAEDQLLRHAMSIFGENWQSVARMVGRHSNQCINRWTKTIAPHKKGKWTEEEDEDLLAAVSACGPVWSKVALRVQGRSDAQCRERFSNVLDPNLNRQEWSPEEDEIIRAAYIEFGGQWGKIVSALKEKLPKNGVRTDNKVS